MNQLRTTILSVSIHLTLLLTPTHISASVIINEIMYNPDGPENYCEYIELLNVGNKVVDLTGFLISDGSANDSLIIGEENGTLVLIPGRYAIILDPDYWEGGGNWYKGRIPGETLILTVRGAALGSGGLTNSRSERVSLLNTRLDTLSSRLYLPDAPDGFSEERILASDDFREGEGDENWQFTAEGTPGYLNLSTPPGVDLAISNLILERDTSRFQTDYKIDYVLTVANLGVNSSSQTYISIFRDRHLYHSFEYYRDHYIPVLDYLEEFAVSGSFENLLPGRYNFRFELQSQDEFSSNDVITDFAYFPYPPSVLAFDEIMSSPPDSIPCEWFELLNRSSESVPIGGWSVRDASNRRTYIDSSSLEVERDGRFLFAEDSTIFRWRGVSRDKTIIPETWISLNDGGDSLYLFDPSGFLIECIFYPTAERGISFQRVSYSGSASEEEWQLNSPLVRGTPGVSPVTELNNVYSSEFDVKVSPNPFSPGSAYNSQVHFEFTMPAADCNLELRLFDINGRELGLLLNTTTHSKRRTWSWDGKQNITEKLSRGIYVYHARAIARQSGRSWETKGTIVSAGSGR